MHRIRGLALGLLWLACETAAFGDELSSLELLGKRLFFDKSLSTPAGQACASCHSPETGFTGADSAVNEKSGIYRGAAPGTVGNRKPPSVAYASFSPPRTFDEKAGVWVGGQFWDGRADDLVTQAKGPFLNPLEMNNASGSDVVAKVRQTDYRDLYDAVRTEQQVPDDADAEFDLIARAIAAYESSREVNAFGSKYDHFLAGRVSLTEAERRGLELFGGKANCSTCHPHQPAADGTPPLFTTFHYENVGTPRNEHNPFYLTKAEVNPDGRKYRDLGLGAVTGDGHQDGKFKIPTLRNVARRPHPQFVKAYLHNGLFKSVKNVIGFYNLRDKSHEKYLEPDVATNVNRDDVGHLGLTEQEEDDLVAFLETLSDGYVLPESPTTPEPAVPPPAPLEPTAVNMLPDPPGVAPVSASSPAAVTDRFRGVRDWARVERFRSRTFSQSTRPPLKR